MSKKFLLVDDDAELCSNLKDWFRGKSIELETAHDGADALQLLKAYSYELILLDWDLPDMTGLNVCTTYRDSGGDTHIIFLTGKDDIDSKEAALISGGDDYVVKPFDVRELYARVQSVLRRSLERIPSEIEIQGLVLKPEERCVTVGDRQIRITPKECAILEYLIRHANRPFSANRLLAAIWPSETGVSEGTVRTSVLNLRRKLAEVGKSDLIKLVVNSGYVIEKR